MGGIFSTDAHRNPLAGANKVYVAYWRAFRAPSRLSLALHTRTRARARCEAVSAVS